MGLTKPRAYQIYDIDYKQAVRVVTTSNIVLGGGAPNTVDGVNLSQNDRVLVTGQSNAVQNGLYYVTTVGVGSDGTWERSVDGNQTGEMQAGLIVMVTEGNVYKDTQWKLTTDDPIVLGVSELDFVLNSLNVYFTSISAGGNVLTASGNASVVNFEAGSGVAITSNVASNTITFTSSSTTPSNISNGTSNVTVVSSGGNVTVGINGIANVAEFSDTGLKVTGNISANVLTVNTLANIASVSAGNIAWSNTDGTYNMGLYNGVTMQAGQEQYYYLEASANITNGQVVGWNGTNGNYVLGEPANAATPGFDSHQVLGIATQDITAGNLGYVTAFGKINGMNTDDFNVNDLLYLDPLVPGGLTNTLPVSPNPKVEVGLVVVKDPTDGVVQARVVAYQALYELQDTDISAPTNNQYLKYTTTGNTWNNVTLSIVDDPTPVLGGDLNGNGYAISTTGNITGNYIFGNGSQLTGIAATFPVADGTSNIDATTNGNVTIGVGGTSNVAVFATTGEYVTGVVSATGNVTGGNLLTTGTIATGTVSSNLNPIANITYSLGNTTNRWKDLWLSNSTLYMGEVAVATTGNALTINGANVLTGNTGSPFSTSGNITGGNILTGGLISATSTITGSSLLGSVVSVTGNVTGGNVLTGGVISSTGNITGGNVTGTNLTGTNVSVTGTATAASTVGGVITGSSASVTGTVTGASVVGGSITLSGNTITAAGDTLVIDPNSTGGTDGNVVIAGNLSVQGNVTYIDSQTITTNELNITLGNNQNTGTALNGGGIDLGNNALAYWRFNNATTSWQSNIALTPAANATLNLGGTSNYWATVYATDVSVSGTVTAASTVGGVITGSSVSVTGTQTAASTVGGVITGSSVSVSGDVTAASTVGGVITGTSVSVSGGVTAASVAGGVITGTSASVTGTQTAASTVGGVITGSSSSVTGNVTGGNVLTGGLISATSTITGGNLATGGTVSATGNATVGNILTSGIVSATGNVTGSNLVTGGTITVTGNATVGNITSSGYYWANGVSLQTDIDGKTTLVGVANVTKDLMGVVNRGQSNISFDNASRTYTITPTSSSWEYYYKGAPANVTVSKSIVIANTSGPRFIKIDPITQDLAEYGPAPDFANDVILSYVYYNANDAKGIIVGDERHGSQRDTTWHTNQHLNIGTIWRSGGALTYTLNDAANIQIGVGTPLVLADEDLTLTINNSATPNGFYEQTLTGAANLEVMYLNGTAYDSTTANTTPWIAGNSLASYNLITNGSGTLVDATEGSYFTYWMLGTNDIRSPVKLVLGRELYANVDAAYGESFTDYGLSFAEQVFMYQIVVQTSSAYANTPKIVISAVRRILDKVATSGSSASAANHNGLTGRDSNDSHPISAITDLTTTLAGKQDTLVSNVNIKTINSTSLLGSGDISIPTYDQSLNTNSSVTFASVSSTGNVTSGNVLTSGIVSATGNITGNYFIGNGSQLTGISAGSTSKIFNGTSEANIGTTDGNANISIGGTSNVVVFASTGEYVTGLLSVTGNITGGNVSGTSLTGSTVSVTGTATAASTVGGVITGTSTSVTGTQTAASTVGGVITGTSISVTGNVTSGNVLTGGLISSTGNVTAGNVSATNHTGTNVSVTGTVTSASTVGGVITGTSTSVTGSQTAASTVGGVITGSSVSVTGTATAASTVGGVITGTSTSVTGTQTAASTVGGVITGTSTSVTGTQTAASTVGGVITGTSVSVTGTTTAASVVGGVMTGSSLSVTGNVSSGNLILTGNANIAGNITTTTTNANLTLDPNGSGYVVFTAATPVIIANSVVANTSSPLQLTGNVSATASNVGQLQVGSALTFADVNIISALTANVNTYSQVIVQNKNPGTAASADFIVNNDTVSGTTVYGDFGINSTTFTTTSSPYTDASGTYLYAAGGNLAVGTLGSNTLKFAVNSTLAMSIANTGAVSVVGNLTAANVIAANVFYSGSGNRAPQITVGTSAPASPSIGDLWVDTN